ncbi:hypothetical protein GP486_003985 [Trichoglossum hirsutum]|uniref:TMEM1 family protein n=1 Tax=Trichoglossum hirsutum TaxID=265104 RepID=A0A9P8RQF2_9PEZI|nr:hypothetical protein GP486_003985 [Trichoglossum hirsutum]
MEPSSSSSKVTVEYFDPYGVFPLISSGLLSRLPLRNLHWKSPSRPLRSISSLHVDLVPYGELQQRSQSPPAAAKSEESIQSFGDILARTRELGSTPDVGAGIYKNPVKERRHQIPGLRQTPYLKVFFLRCDDTDAYKATSRKQLRDWIKEHATQSSQSTASVGGQENHDAFEWLIVHVVLPNTAAAAQPHVPKQSGNGPGGGTEKVSSTSRWPGRGTSSILDKIRSDFNGSSKSAKDRVAQIRVQKNPQSPPELSTSTPLSGEALREQENAWSDVISKLKSLILTSFDLRVGQYEEDVREKDAQRNLPGWNFCTFFVLKEGLAKGFESVGLVEDALVGYDELAVGLDAIAREQAGGGSGGGHARTFLAYTEDLWQQARAARKTESTPDSGGNEGPQRQTHPSEDEILTDPPLSATKKPYRELILSNNISVFDFRCYIFARQLSLLLRLGNASSSRSGLMAKLPTHPATAGSEYSFHDDGHGRTAAHNDDESEDLITLSEVCKRSIEFITSVSRIMRSDLWNAHSHAVSEGNHKAEGPGERRSSRANREISQIIDSLVSSWTFSLTQQILVETSTKVIPIPLTDLPDTNSSRAKIASPGGPVQEPKAAIPEPKTIIHPARTSSLTPRHSMLEPLSPGVSISSPALSSGSNTAPPSGAKPGVSRAGLEDLAAYRAELYLLGRRVLEHLGREREWHTDWSELAGIHVNTGSSMEEIDLEDNANTEGEESEAGGMTPEVVDPCAIKSSLLRSALQGRDSFYSLYENLTDKALRHYTIANRTRSVESVMADLAALKFHLGDYATAAAYFHRMAPFYAEEGWSLVETSMLVMYARCLKEMRRNEEYIDVALKLLAKAVAREKRLVSRRRGGDTGMFGRDLGFEPNDCFDGRVVATRGYVQDLASLSKELSLEITVQMSRYFDDIYVEPYPRHPSDRDGFQLQLRMRHLLEDDLEVQSARVRIVGATGGQGREIWLESSSRFVLKKRGLSRVWVGSNAVIPGSYIADRILLECHKVIFVHETLSKASVSTPTGFSGSFSATAVTAAKKSRIIYYAPPTALQAKTRLPKFIHLDEVRSIEIEINTGWNNVLRGELRLRCASAGLRLRTADTELVDGNTKIYDKTKPGIIALGPVAANSSVVFRIPYVLESDLNDLTIKIEVAYATENGDFLFAASSSESIVLPLGVNVLDIFKEKALVTIVLNGDLPRLPELDGSEVFATSSGSSISSPIVVFPRLPACFIYKIVRRHRKSRVLPTTIEDEQKPLALHIEYRCLDEEIEETLESAFVDALNGSPFGGLSRLLVPTLFSWVRKRSAHELEMIGLLGEINLGSFKDLGWSDALDGLSGGERGKVERWLTNWHEKNLVIPLPEPSTGCQERNREIVIPVEVPQVQVVHTVDLCVLDPEGSTSSGVSMATIGQLLVAELRIKHTRVWDTGKVNATLRTSVGSRLSSADAPLEFTYEIHANPDQWLIGGRRRVQFAARENELHKFPIVLLPLRPGHLLLPTVDIKPFVPQSNQADNEEVAVDQTRTPTQLPPVMNLGAPGQRPSLPATSGNTLSHQGSQSPVPETPVVTCETDCRNQGETILILPNVKSTTVSLDPAHGGGAILVESEKRIDSVVG